MARSRQRARAGVAANRRIVGIGVAVGLLLLVGFTAVAIRIAEDALRHEAERGVRSTAQLGAQLVGEQSLRFEEVVGAYAQRLSALPEPRRAQLPPDDARTARIALDQLVANVSGLESAVFVDPLGRVVVGGGGSKFKAGTDLSGRDWFRGVERAHGPYLSRAYRSALGRHRKITVAAVPVRGSGGRPIGIIVASESRYTQQVADMLGRQLDATLTVTDQSGVAVAQTGHATSDLISLAKDDRVATALRGDSGVQVRDDQVSGYAAVPRTHWTVVADVPTSRAFADVGRLRLTLLGAAGVVAFFVLWLVPLLVTRLGRAREALDASTAFQTDLLPTQLPPGVRSLYVASERRMLLGGDFLDAVTTPDGGLAVCIGDVCGHGPRAAALGATLRAGWRTLASAGRGVDRLELLDRLVEDERRDEDLFVTMACATVSPESDHVRLALAGHPPPILVTHDAVAKLDGTRGPALGLGAGARGARWPVTDHDVDGPWSLTLYTDGLIEARATPEEPRLGVDGLVDLIRASRFGAHLDGEELIARARELAAASLSDDVALLLVEGGPGRAREATTPGLAQIRAG